MGKGKIPCRLSPAMLTLDSSVLAPSSPKSVDSIPFSGLVQAFLLSSLPASRPIFTNLIVFSFGAIITLLTLNFNFVHIQNV